MSSIFTVIIIVTTLHRLLFFYLAPPVRTRRKQTEILRSFRRDKGSPNGSGGVAAAYARAGYAKAVGATEGEEKKVKPKKDYRNRGKEDDGRGRPMESTRSGMQRVYQTLGVAS